MSVADKIATIAENEQKVFDAGKKAEYDAFWDTFQMNGTRTNYCYGFRNWEAGMWNAANLKPKYDITIVGYSPGTFHSVKGIKDFDSLGIKLDVSQVTDFADGFYNSDFEHVGELDLSKCMNVNSMFNSSKIKVIDKLIFGAATPMNKPINYAHDLEHVIFGGTIGTNGLDLRNVTKLDRESLVSLLNCLEDKSSDTSGTAWSLPLGATNLAKLTDAEKAIATAKGWTLS